MKSIEISAEVPSGILSEHFARILSEIRSQISPETCAELWGFLQEF